VKHEMIAAPSGIGYPIWQAGAGTPLVLLHGFTGSHETWRDLTEHLTSTHLVVALDLPGHGMSTLPDSLSWTFASVVDDLAWMIATLPSGNADVLGYSMGGRVALALTVEHPERVRRLVLESASPGIADQRERRQRQAADEQLAARIRREGVETFVTYWEALPMWETQAAIPDVVRERQRQTRLGHTSDGLATNLLATGTGAQESYWADLAKLKTPVMVIAGELDLKFAQIAARMTEAMPNAQLEIVAGAGHAVHLEQPAEYVQRVALFLEQTGVDKKMKRSDRD
jgi:2-succinyl-6-hydroxy-2,4-cyclohexadiene-1-carboxylate synthase